MKSMKDRLARLEEHDLEIKDHEIARLSDDELDWLAERPIKQDRRTGQDMWDFAAWTAEDRAQAEALFLKMKGRSA